MVHRFVLHNGKIHDASEKLLSPGQVGLLKSGGAVRLRWETTPGALHVIVEDEGPGVSNTANLFVPFFTTKPGGSGIGLVLCRQIAEAHGGSLTLANRNGARGSEARLVLPA